MLQLQSMAETSPGLVSSWPNNVELESEHIMKNRKSDFERVNADFLDRNFSF